MERVAEPAPSFALTTSSPPNCTPVTELDTAPLIQKPPIRTVDERIVLVGRDLYRGLGQAEERNNGLSRVTTNDGNGRLGWGLLATDGGNEGLGTDDIECGDTEELLGVEHASALKDLGGNGDSRVDGVGDDQEEGLGGILGGTLDEALHDAGVDLEQIITGHSRLA